MFKVVDDNELEKIDTTKDFNEQINKEEVIYSVFVSKKGILTMDIHYKEIDRAIEREEKKIIKFNKDAKKAKTDNAIKICDTQVKVSNTYITLYKLDKMIFSYYIEKKDISKMAELFKSKYTQLISNLFEYSSDLVDLDEITEGDHLENAKRTKKDFDRNMRHIEIYTSATFVVITNHPIKIIR